MFKQAELNYTFDALEPTIDTLTMETHYGKHHAAYTAAFNTMAEKAGVQDKSVEEILSALSSITDEDLRTGIRNNGGGYYNHNMYFTQLSPNGKSAPEGELAEKINEAFGSFDEFKEKISALALGQFGSGWAWLSVTSAGELVLSNTPNQDNPISLGTGNTPIFTIDVWEHAYYLKYKNLRASYVKELFNVVDWSVIERRYEAAK